MEKNTPFFGGIILISVSIAPEDLGTNVQNWENLDFCLRRYVRSGSQICFPSKNSEFFKNPEWPPNDYQMTPNDLQWPTYEHPTNPQWLTMTISWHIFGSYLLSHEIRHIKV